MRTIATVLMLLLGGLSIYIGYVQQDQGPFYELVFSAGGAALFGASLAMIIELIMGTEIGDIRDYLMRVQKFESAPDYLDAVIGKWYGYYLTKENGTVIWKAAHYSIEKDAHGNGLHGHYEVKNDKGVKRVYQIEAGIRGGALVIFSAAEKSTEFEPIDIIPTALQTFMNVHIGVAILETWDGELALSRSMYARSPLYEGAEDTPEGQAALDKIYRNTAASKKITDLLPLRFSEAAS